MRTSEMVACLQFPCGDVRHDRYLVPDVEMDPKRVRLIMISEAAPEATADYYYASGSPLFAQTTVQAFQDAGLQVASIGDIAALGIYLTTAIKCGKTGYGIQTATIKECSSILGQELALFPNVQAYLLMGDVAIKAINTIAARESQGRAIPAGSTYKIRGQEYYFRGRRAFPSYLQAGPSFFIEKSKRKMIAEDIAAAVRLLD